MKKVLNANKTSSHVAPSQQRRIRQRKTQQQLQKENQSATIIQSAWRGCQVRKEINGMNKAAAKIQAVFRGNKSWHLTHTVSFFECEGLFVE
uniref:Uncharacterized protein n=1 Tax=Gopherus evgoodei TaxID=1825980 RepID=A0A8C4VK51_9SAUR